MDFIAEWLPKLEHFRLLGYWLILLITFLESLVLVGGLVPGTTTVLLAGALAAHGYFDAGDLIWFATAGAILGDGLSFWLGGHRTGWFKESNRFFKASYLEAGKAFFQKHGAKSIFLGRFVGVARMLVPFVAGLTGMAPRRFYFWNITSALAWSVSHIAAGYFLGEAWRTFAVWTSRGAIFLAALAVVILCLNLLRRALLKQGRWLLAALRSMWVSAWRRIAANSRVAEFARRHPRLVSRIGARFDKSRFSGLPLTLLALAFLYTLLLFGGVVEDVVTSDRIVTVDRHLASLLSFYRGETAVRVFLWITLLGTAWIIISEGVFASAWLWLGGQRDFIVPFWVTLAGSSFFCNLGKLAFRRARPPDVGAIVETTFSFPSGHATVAVAFYGFLAYCLWRRTESWTLRLNLFFGGVMLVLAIGFSRLYLGVHYLSDVLAGYLLGLLWLIIGVSLVESRRYGAAGARPQQPQKSVQGRPGHVLLACAAALCYILTGLAYQPPRAVPAARPAAEIADGDFAGAFARYRLPRFTEAISGHRQEPLNLVIVARDDAALAREFENAGWLPADAVSPGSAVRAVKASAEGTAYPTAPIAPLFWNGVANGFGFEKSEGAVGWRLQVRVWRTNLSAGEAGRVFVAMACRDMGMKWWFIHRLDPDLDAAREAVRRDLQESGLADVFRKIAFVEPQTGRTYTGDRFFTDGFLWVIYYKQNIP